jgi:hypothetical protein
MSFSLVVQLKTLACDWSGACFEGDCQINIFRNHTTIKQFLDALIQIAFFNWLRHGHHKTFIVLFFKRPDCLCVLRSVAFRGLGQSFLQNAATTFGVHLTLVESSFINNFTAKNICLHAHQRLPSLGTFFGHNRRQSKVW